MHYELLVSEVNAVRQSAVFVELTCVPEELGHLLKTNLLKHLIGEA